MTRPCLDCGRLIAKGSRCPSCDWKRNASYAPDRLRGRAWMKRRATVLRRGGGMCERCREAVAEEVHHLGELSDNRPESLLAVCRACHRALGAEKR